MMLSIRDLLCATPNADGSTDVSAKVSMQNDTGDVVRMIRSTCAYFDGKGQIIGSGTDTEDHVVFLAPGESLSLEPSLNGLNAHMVSDGRFGLRVFAGLFAREYIRLGEREVPDEADAVVWSHVTAPSSILSGDVLVTVARDRRWRDSASVICSATVQNSSGMTLPKAVLWAELLDRDGTPIELAQQDYDVAAHFPGVLQTGFTVHRSLLLGARVRLAMALHRPVGLLVGDATGRVKQP